MTASVKLWKAIIAGVLAALASFLGAQQLAPKPAAPPIGQAPTRPELDPPPAPMPPPPAASQPNALAAIGRIQFGNAGCTATVIGPRRTDGRYLVLTANHCTAGQPGTGSMRLRDGTAFGIRKVNCDPRADCCWCITDVADRELPFALLAETTPAVGTHCWHAGFGFDKPGNREDGTVATSPLPDGKVGMDLSVSNGDSGGGILTDEGDRVFSCVCCTSGIARRSRMYGASVEAIRRAMPTGHVSEEWVPVPIPTVPDYPRGDGGDRRLPPEPDR